MISDIPNLRDLIKTSKLQYNFPPATSDPIVKNLKVYPNGFLGQGAFGEVEKAYSYDSLNNLIYIAKKTIFDLTQGLNFILKEIIMILSVSTVKFYNIYYEGPDIVILMEFIEGIDGDNFVRFKGKKLNQDGSKKLLKYLLEIRACMDAKGATHRDIKPINIIFKYDEKNPNKIIDVQSITLVDWGLGCLYVDRIKFRACYPTMTGTIIYICPVIGDIVNGNIAIAQTALLYILECNNIFFGSRDNTAVYIESLKQVIKSKTFDSMKLRAIIKDVLLDGMILSYCDLWSIALTVVYMVIGSVDFKAYSAIFKASVDTDVYDIVADILSYPVKTTYVGCKNASVYLEKLRDYDTKTSTCLHVANKYDPLGNVLDIYDWRKLESVKYDSNGTIANIRIKTGANPKALFNKK